MKLDKRSTSCTIFLKRAFYFILVSQFFFTACEVEKPVPTYTLTTSVTPSEGGKISVSPK